MLLKRTIFGISVAQVGCKAYTVNQDKISFSVTCRLSSRPVDLIDIMFGFGKIQNRMNNLHPV